jgi:DNA recombination protein RmuC
MFIPGEAFVGAAAQADPALLEDGINQRVVIATPTTLIALLRAINHGWRQEQLAANAERISELGRQLYDRLRTLGGHFESLAAALRNATNAFNQAVGSLEARVLPTARKFRELGAAKGDELPVLGTVDEQPRALDAPEFPRQLEASDTAS